MLNYYLKIQDRNRCQKNFQLPRHSRTRLPDSFAEVRRRKEAIHRLLVGARGLADQLRGVAEDNQRQIAPALREVEDLLDFLTSKEKELKATMAALGPYVSILGNIIGTGPWFDAYVVNLLAIPTGEFQPGRLKD